MTQLFKKGERNKVKFNITNILLTLKRICNTMGQQEDPRMYP